MWPQPGKLTKEQLLLCYRQSRATTVDENTFGAEFSQQRKSFENVVRYFWTVKVPHNYLRKTENVMYCPQDFADSEEIDGSIEKEHQQESAGDNNSLLIPLKKGSRYKNDVVAMRETLNNYSLSLYSLS